MSYEKRLRRLDEIVTMLDGDAIPLDDALKLFEEGVELLRLASADLENAESRVKLLIERADGVFDSRDVDV